MFELVMMINNTIMYSKNNDNLTLNVYGDMEQNWYHLINSYDYEGL